MLRNWGNIYLWVYKMHWIHGDTGFQYFSVYILHEKSASANSEIINIPKKMYWHKHNIYTCSLVV